MNPFLFVLESRFLMGTDDEERFGDILEAARVEQKKIQREREGAKEKNHSASLSLQQGEDLVDELAQQEDLLVLPESSRQVWKKEKNRINQKIDTTERLARRARQLEKRRKRRKE